MTDFVSLSDLRTLVRQRADQENSQFVTDQELRQYINRSYCELYDLLITNANSEDYFLNSSTVTLVSGTQTYDLPADFYKLRGVDLNMGSDTFPLRRYNFPQRDVGSRYSVPYRYRYHIQGSSLRLTPSPSTNDTLTVWYIPSPKKFLEKTATAITRGTSRSEEHTSELDSSGLADPTTFGNIESRFDFYSGWDEYIICGAAIDCMVKEESDPSALMKMKEETKIRILSVSDNRDLGEPATVTDMAVYYTDPGSYTWYS